MKKISELLQHFVSNVRHVFAALLGLHMTAECDPSNIILAARSSTTLILRPSGSSYVVISTCFFRRISLFYLGNIAYTKCLPFSIPKFA